MTSERDAFRAARLGCIIASVVVLSTTVIVLGALTPGYSQMADTVSRLGSRGQPYAVWARGGILLYGLLILVGARPLGDYAPGKARVLAYSIIGYGVAAVVAGLAPKDPPRAAHTLASQVHVAATIVGGVTLLAALTLVALSAPLRATRRTAVVVATLILIGAAVFPFLWGSDIYGLVERVLLALATLWLVSLALPLLEVGRSQLRGHRRQ